MIESFDDKETPNLGEFPSAKAQNSAPVDTVKPKRVRKSGWSKVVGRLFAATVIFFVLGAGALFLLLSSGPISNDHLKTQVEAQLSDFLGEKHSAQIENLNFLLGKSGLIALRAANVRITDDQASNLGIAKEVLVTLRALPLLSGNVSVKRVVVNDASLSLLPITKVANRGGQLASASDVNISAILKSWKNVFDSLYRNVDETGLEEILVTNTKLVGFDQLDLRSKTARIVNLVLEKDVNFQSGLFMKSVVEAEQANWQIAGAWREMDDGSSMLEARVGGADLRELFPDVPPDDMERIYAESPFSFRSRILYSKSGTPGEAIAQIDLSEGRLRLDEDYDTKLVGGQFNFRALPEKNQIEIDRSPVKVPTATLAFLGGVRFPTRATEAGKRQKPVFELIANEIESRALIADGKPAKAAVRLGGWLDLENKTVYADNIVVTSETGNATGVGVFGFAGETPAVKLSLDVPKIRVEELKQLWHPVIAPKLRDWIADGVVGGTVENARVEMDVPSGILGNIKHGKRFEKDDLVVSLSVRGAAIKSFGKVPMISDATGDVRHSGMTSNINLKSGQVALKGGRKIELSKGVLNFGDFSLDAIPARLTLTAKADASAAVQLGEYEPLNYASKLNVDPGSLSGGVTADADVKFNLEDGGKIGGLDWRANIKVEDFASKKAISGRKFSNANLSIVVEEATAKVNGTATIDGVNAKVAMVEHLDGRKAASERSVLLTLNDKARRNLGMDTDVFMRGPIDVVVSESATGVQHIDADLTKATLSLPWIQWSKGKGIKATASFDLIQSKGRQTLENFTLKGAGFHAVGKLIVDKKGLVSASIANARLNKTDNLAVKVDRKKGTYVIDVNARSYDARGIIQSFLQNDSNDPNAKSKGTVVVKGKVARLQGFGGQILKNVFLDYVQKNGRVVRAKVSAQASDGARTTFGMTPSPNGQRTTLVSGNAGSILRFLDIYSKVRGGSIRLNLVRGKSRVFEGGVTAKNFTLINEPKLGQLMRPPRPTATSTDRGTVEIRKVAKFDPRNARIRQMSANVRMAPKSLVVSQGRIQGGDAGAAFEGTVYDKNDRTDVSGTFLPAYGLNQVISKIPIIGLLTGNGQKRGLIGITFRLRGPYKNPDLIVNPVSIFAPGVFRKIFEY